MNRWLAVSLGLNVAFGVVLFAIGHGFTRPTPATMPGSAAGSHAPSSPALPATSLALARTGGWRSWLEQARAAGVPPRTIAGLVASDFEVCWEQRQRALQARYERGEIDAATLARTEADHDDARDAELRTALGADGFRNWDKANTLREMNLAAGDLNATDADAVYDLRKELLRRRHELETQERNGELDSADLSRALTEAQAHYDDQIHVLLGGGASDAPKGVPASAIAALRRELGPVDVTDAQLAALARTRQTTDAALAALDRAAQADPAKFADHDTQRSAIEAAQQRDFQDILGREKFSVWEKSQDDTYRTLVHYSPAWQLQPGDIERVYQTMNGYAGAVSDQYQQALDAEQRGQAIDWSAVDQKVQTLNRETERTLKQMLGDTRFEKLRQANALHFVGDAGPGG